MWHYCFFCFHWSKAACHATVMFSGLWPIACMFKAYTGRNKFSDKLICQLFGGVHCMECPLFGDVRCMECPLYGDVRSMECPLYGDVHCMEVFTHKKNLLRNVSQ